MRVIACTVIFALLGACAGAPKMVGCSGVFRPLNGPDQSVDAVKAAP